MSRRAAPLIRLLPLLAALTVGSGCAPRFDLHLPPSERVPDADTIQQSLSVHDYAGARAADDAVGLILPVPPGEEKGELFAVRALPLSHLPPPALHLESPSEALQQPGLYVGLFSRSQRETRPVHYVTRVADPRLLLREAGGGSEVRGRTLRVGSGVLATRVPFIPGTDVVLFDVTPQARVGDVHAALWFGRRSPSSKWSSNRVRVRTQ